MAARDTTPNGDGRRLHVILQLPFHRWARGRDSSRDKAWVLAAFAPEASGDDITRVLVTQERDAMALVEDRRRRHSHSGMGRIEQGYEMEQIHMLGFYPEAVRLSA